MSIEILGVQFTPYPYNHNWENVSGIYIFAEQKSILTNTQTCLYVGETNSFRTRFVDNKHEKWDKALSMGMTHVLVAREYNAISRAIKERRLIDKLNPPLNER